MDWSYILDILLKALGSTAATAITTLAGILFAKLSSKIKDSRVNNYIKHERYPDGVPAISRHHRCRHL